MRAVGAFVAVFAALAVTAAAQTGTVFNRPGSGARAAVANAFIAISDDGITASWNPAGLGQLRKPEFSIVTSTTHQSPLAGLPNPGRSGLFSPIDVGYTYRTSTSRAWRFR
jgi:hypothetical protein